MSAYPPPTETLPIFNVNEFIGTTNTSQGGGGSGGGTFVNYPTAQGPLALVGFNSSGTSTITNLVVNGTTDINNNVNLSGDLVLDGGSASINFLNGTIQDSAYTGLTSSAGTYPDANLTIDANGKITAISAGTGSAILTTNNTFTGTNTFTNTVDISGTTLNIADNSILECNEATVNIGDGGQGALNIECPINVGGFGDITLLNSDILMIDDAVITQSGTRTIPNAMYSTNILNGSYIQYNSDSTQQTSAFTGAGALAGSYTQTAMTVDANGKITALSSGTANGDADMLYLTNTSGCLDASQIVETNWDITIGFQPSGVRAIQTNATGQYVAVAQNSVGYSFSSNYGQSFTTNGGVYASERTRGVAFSASGRYFLVQTGNGFNGNLYWSPNYGASFTGLIGGGITSTADVCVDTTCIDADGTHFYTFNLLSSAPTLYRFVLTGAGAITTATTTNFAGNTTFSNVGALRCSADGKYVIFRGQTGGVNYIYYSSNYGATFTRVSTPTNTTLGGGGQTVAVSKTGEIMVGVCRNTSSGNTVVFVSNNYGANWFSAGNILVNASVGFIFDRIAMNGDGNIIVATAVDDAGIEYFYATSNLGFTWYEATGSNAGERFCALSNDGSLLYSILPTPANDFVSTSFPLRIVNTTNLEAKQVVVSVPSYFEDFYHSNSSTSFGDIIPFTTLGGGTTNIFGGAFDATLQTVGERRLGNLFLNSAGTNEVYNISDNPYRFPMMSSITYGFIPLGSSNFPLTSGSRTDQLQISMALGFMESGGISLTFPNFTGTGVYWRLTATTSSAVNWSLYEDDVIQSTLSGTDLTGQLTGKWLRCKISFYNNGANYFGEFWNLTDNAYFRTNNFATNAPNAQTNMELFFGVGSNNGTTKTMGVDYVAVELNTLPLGGLSTSFR